MGYISACSIPNTIRRGKNYYLHFRLPNNKFFRASLGCDSAERTRYILTRLSLFISLVKSDRMEPIHLLSIVKDMKKLEQKDIDDYLFHSQSLYYAAAKKIPAEVRKMLREEMPISPEKSRLKSLSKMLGTIYYSEGAAFSEEQVIKELSEKFDLVGKEDEVDYISSQCDIFFKQYCDAKLAFLEQSQVEYLQLISSLEPREINALTPILSDSTNMVQEVSQITLTEAWSQFVAFTSNKKGWTAKTIKDNDANFEFIKLVLGENTPVVNITKRNIKEVLDLAESLPQRNKSPYNKLTLQECLDFDVPQEDTISSRSVMGYLKLCQSFFSAYLTKEADILSVSPTLNVTRPHRSQSYGKYTRTEMASLVTCFLSLPDWRKWVFLLLSYTGARRGEIVSLRRDDVKFDEDSQRYFISINESKTDAGKRNIPLHNKVIEWGFISFVDSKNSGLLFPEITYANQVSKRFMQIRDDLDISAISYNNERRIIHSLRHTFITEAMKKIANINLIQQVVGHEHSNIGQTQKYTGHFDVSDLATVVDSVDWI